MTAAVQETAITPEAPAQKRAKPGFFSLQLLDNRFAALHGFRVIAIISVIQYHVTWIFAGEQGIKLGKTFVDDSLVVFFGMDLFFILSGFLIGSILLRSLAERGSQDLRRFYLRRIFRTFPPYWVVLTVLAIAFPMTTQQKSHLWVEYAYGTNFLSLDRPEEIMFWGWSLSLEEQFYLTVPILLFALNRLKSDRSRLILLGLFWVSALVVRLIVYFNGTRPWNDFILFGAVYFRTKTRFDTLVAGIALAFVYDRYGDRVAKWLTTPVHRALVGLTSLTCLWLLVKPEIFGIANVQLMHMFLWGSVTSIMYFGVLLLLLHGDGWIHRFLGWSGFRKMATLGYGIYLVHIPIIDRLMVPLGKHWQEKGVSVAIIWPTALVLTFLLSTAIGYVLHIAVEKPSLWVRQRLAG